MYECLCGQKYDLSNIVYEIIGLVNDEQPERFVIIVCSNCNSQRITGGELYYSDKGEREIHMFGEGIFPDEHEQKIWINPDGSIWVKNPRFYAKPISP